MDKTKEYEELKNFVKWVITWIFKEDFTDNAGAFAELACRRLQKIGYTFKIGEYWFYDGVKIENE